MDTKTESLYKEYLKEKLDLVFNEEVGEEYSNELDIAIIEEKVEEIKNTPNFKLPSINQRGEKLYKLFKESGVTINSLPSSDGIFLVKQNNKYNYKDLKGNIIYDEWLDCALALELEDDSIPSFLHNNNYSFSDTRSNKLCRERFINTYYKNEASKLSKVPIHFYLPGQYDSTKNRYMRKEHNYINKDGIIFNEWYEDATSFHNGFAIVIDGYNKCNYIDTEGKLLLDEWFLPTKVKRLSPYLSSSKKNYDDYMFGGIYDYYNKLVQSTAIFENKGSYNIINTEGKLLLDYDYNNIENINNGKGVHRIVRRTIVNGDKYNIIDGNGKFISENWYDDIEPDRSGGFTAIVSLNNKYNVINLQGELLCNWSIIKPKISKVSNCIAVINNKVVFLKKDIKDYYKIRKTINSYTYYNTKDKFIIKYKPFYIYNSKYMLCLAKNNDIYLYDRYRNDYLLVGNIDFIDYDKNFIHDIVHHKIYFIYDDKVFDITNYYKENLLLKHSIKVSKGIDILTLEEFELKNDEELRRLLEEEKEKNKIIAEQQKKNQSLINLNKTKENQIHKEKDILKQREEVLKKLLECITLLEELDKETNKITRISFPDLYYKVENHLEIKPLLQNNALLKHIDLRLETFKNVKISGLNFSNCNIRLSPQAVYKKDLRNCIFEGVYLGPFVDFTGVDIRGCKFSYDNNPNTDDCLNPSFANAIYDESTTYNGIPLPTIISKKKISRE